MPDRVIHDAVGVLEHFAEIDLGIALVYVRLQRLLKREAAEVQHDLFIPFVVFRLEFAHRPYPSGIWISKASNASQSSARRRVAQFTRRRLSSIVRVHVAPPSRLIS